MVSERHQDDINVFLNRIYSTPHFLGNSCQSDRRMTVLFITKILLYHNRGLTSPVSILNMKDNFLLS